MSEILKSSLTTLIAGERPTPSAIQDCFRAMMDGDVGEAQIAAFLIALKIRGEQVDDIAAAANVMREKAQTIIAPDTAMDIVGTGGDGFGTYNISTACAFVVAGCGVPVAKHGNSRVVKKWGGRCPIVTWH